MIVDCRAHGFPASVFSFVDDEIVAAQFIGQRPGVFGGRHDWRIRIRIICATDHQRETLAARRIRGLREHRCGSGEGHKKGERTARLQGNISPFPPYLRTRHVSLQFRPTLVWICNTHNGFRWSCRVSNSG